MILDDLADRNYASTTEVAALWDGADPRTIRRMAEAGEIPHIKVGAQFKIPVSWLRHQMAGVERLVEPAPLVDLDQLAERVADRVATRILGAFAALAPAMTTAGPAPPGPAVTTVDQPPGT